MKTISRAALLGVSLLGVQQYGYGQANSEPSPPTRGAIIGKHINEAINEVLLNVPKLIKAIFGSSSSSANKPDVTRELQSAAKDARLKAAAKLKPLGDIARDLSVVSSFLEKTVPALQSTARALARLDTASPNASVDWGPNGVGKELKELDSFLLGLNGIKSRDLDGVDKAFKFQLIQVRNLYNSNRQRIVDAASRKDPTELRVLLYGVQDLLNSVNSIGGSLMADLSFGISGLISELNDVKPMGDDSGRLSRRFDELTKRSLSLAEIALRNK